MAPKVRCMCEPCQNGRRAWKASTEPSFAVHPLLFATAPLLTTMPIITGQAERCISSSHCTHALNAISGTNVTRREHSGDACRTVSETSSVTFALLAKPPLQTAGTSACASRIALMNLGLDAGA